MPTTKKTKNDDKPKELPKPRSLRKSDYRYTVDEFISRLIAHDDGRVIFVDECDLYEYHFQQKPDEDVCKQLVTATDNDVGNIFSAYIISEDVTNVKYYGQYWNSTVPGGDLFKYAPDDSSTPHAAMEYPAAKLKSVHRAYPGAVQILQSLPVKALKKWLQFVGRKFSAVPRATADSPAPFDTFWM